MPVQRPQAAAAARSCQSCPTQCDPIDGSPAGSPVPGILQARALEGVVISFSNAWKWKVKVKSLSRVRPLATPWTAAYQAPPSMGFSKSTGVGCHCLLWQSRRLRFNPWFRKITWRRKWQSLQYPCLENFMNRGAWWAPYPCGHEELGMTEPLAHTTDVYSFTYLKISGLLLSFGNYKHNVL